MLKQQPPRYLYILKSFIAVPFWLLYGTLCAIIWFFNTCLDGVIWCCYTRRYALSRMEASDALWCDFDVKHNNHIIINAIIIIDETNIDIIRRAIEERWVKQFERFSSTVVKYGQNNYFKPQNEHFDITKHVFVVNQKNSIQTVCLTKESTPHNSNSTTIDHDTSCNVSGSTTGNNSNQMQDKDDNIPEHSNTQEMHDMKHDITCNDQVSDEMSKGCWSKHELKEYMNNEILKPLPLNLPLWQMQFIPQYHSSDMTNTNSDDEQDMQSEAQHTNESRRSVLIFRIHHVIADGIALVRLLLEALADQNPTISNITENRMDHTNDNTSSSKHQSSHTCSNTSTDQSSHVCSTMTSVQSSSIHTHVSTDRSFPISNSTTTTHNPNTAKDHVNHMKPEYHPRQDLKTTSHSTTSPAGIPTQANLTKRRLSIPKWECVLRALIETPFQITQKMLTPPDRSVLHGPKLSGQRQVAWLENGSMRDIRILKYTISKFTGCNITLNDLLVGILGNSLHQYLLRRYGYMEDTTECFDEKYSLDINHPEKDKTDVDNGILNANSITCQNNDNHTHGETSQEQQTSPTQATHVEQETSPTQETPVEQQTPVQQESHIEPNCQMDTLQEFNTTGNSPPDRLTGSLKDVAQHVSELHNWGWYSNSSMQYIRASVPVSLRNSKAPLKVHNEFSVLLPCIPLVPRPTCAATGIQAIDTILTVHNDFEYMKNAAIPLTWMFLMQLTVRALPNFLGHKLLDLLSDKCTAVLTNVPGPRSYVSIDGVKLHEMSFWAPSRHSVGISFSLFTYGPHVNFGVNADSALIPNPQDVVNEYGYEIQRLLADCKKYMPREFYEAIAHVDHNI